MKLHEILILSVLEPDEQIFLRSQIRFRMQFLRSTEINSFLHRDDFFLLKFKLYVTSTIFYEISQNFNMLCNSFSDSRLLKT